MTKREIENKLKEKKSFVWIKRQITPQEVDQIKDEKIPGIGLKKEFKRFYPNKNLASQVLGFCDVDSQGIEGVEKSMDSYLISDVRKDDFQPNSNIDDGLNLILTLDSNIQAFAEKSLKDEVINTDSEFGSFILLDGYSGELLAMANYPDFDPNSYQKYSSRNYRNNAVFNQFEPGSVMKVFSLLSLLDNQSIDENDFFYCNGQYEKNGQIVKCTGIHHSINYNGIIKYSCNAGMLEAAEHIKDVDLLHYLKQFGFGSRTAVQLPGEQPGILRDIDKWSSRSMLAIPMGQEISVNALQITRAATTLVNDGVMIEPSIIKSIVNNDNKLIKSFKRTEVRRVLKNGTSKKILDAMKTTTDIGGTVRTLSIEGLEFSAKSGTGQIYDFKTNKYLTTDVTSSLLTVFPYSKPRYILYIVFQKPKKVSQWGGIIGAITANNFLKNLTGYLNVFDDSDFVINRKDIKVNKEYRKIESLPVNMPDLSGLTLADVFDVFSKVKVNFKVYGTGRVYNHSPEKGETVNSGDTVKVYLRDQ